MGTYTHITYIQTSYYIQTHSEEPYLLTSSLMRTTRKGGTKNYKNNHQANGNTSEDYDVHYYGDDNFLKTDAYEKEKNIFESRINELEWKNQALGWKNKVLTISVIAFLLSLFIGILTISIINEFKLEQTR